MHFFVISLVGLHMVTTRQCTMTDITFDHVMVGLLSIKTNHHTYKTLQENGLSDAYDIICLTKEIIDCLVADDVDDNGDTIMKDKPITLYNRFRI
jgi:hypothetical protein